MDLGLKQRRARLYEMCGKNIYPWLVEVGEKVVRRGLFPMNLCDFYTDPVDKEVAGIIDLVMPINNKNGYIIETRNMLGGSLWELVKNRNFMFLTENRRILRNSALTTATIFNILDWVWEVTREDKVSLEYAVLGELGITRMFHKSPMAEVVPNKGDLHQKLEILLAKMTLKDGFGVGLWDSVEEESLACPYLPSVRKTLHAFYPISKRVPSDEVADIISFFGFKKQIDFLFSSWGYEYVTRHEPQATASFEKTLAKCYRKGYITYNREINIPTKCLD